MNQSEPAQEQIQNQPVVGLAVPRREVRVVVDDSPQGYLFDTARFEHAMRIAGAMAASNVIPKHLREDKNGPFEPETIRANCFQIVNQAIRWGFDPFALLKESYVVAGNLGYQGKLITAVINARAGLKRNLDFEFNDKTGDDRQVTVIGTFKDEYDPRTVTLTVRQSKTANEIWVKDPEQKLCYSGAIKWARRHAPEVILGVLTDDDIDKIAASEAKPARARIVEKPNFEEVMAAVKDVAEQEVEGTVLPDELKKRFDEEAAKVKRLDKVQDIPTTPEAAAEDQKIVDEYVAALPEDHPHKKWHKPPAK